MSKKVLYFCDICGDEIKCDETLFEITVGEQKVQGNNKNHEVYLTYNGIDSQLLICKKCWHEADLMSIYNLLNEDFDKLRKERLSSPFPPEN